MGVLTMADVAARMGRHYDTFRKEWRGWTDFPQPLPGRWPRWDAAALEAWIAERSRRRPPAKAARAAPPPDPARRAEAAWEQLERARGQ